MAQVTSVPKRVTVVGQGPIWWSNAIFFVSMHVLALVGATYLSPWHQLRTQTLWRVRAELCIISWQLATFGITIGYHRLWSHRSFTAAFPLRVVLAGMGCLGFQGSIKWWVLRHRLHHRFTDTESDPYNAKQGLYHSHMGWIFRKPTYPRISLIDKKDLDGDPVVRFQHKYYIPLTLFLSLVMPTLIGWTWGDAMGGYIWGGVIARIMIQHATFCINSLAHYLGDQAYSEDVTARGNFVLALFTGGEANHNYHHAFPRDYRNGPRVFDWDPSKWIIWGLHFFTPWVPKMHQTPEAEILRAKAHVLAVRAEKVAKGKDDAEEEEEESSSFKVWGSFAELESDEDRGSSTSFEGVTSSASRSVSGSSSASGTSTDWGEDEILSDRRAGIFSAQSLTTTRRRYLGRSTPLPKWTRAQLVDKLVDPRVFPSSSRTPIVIVVNGFAVDVTRYAQDHPGGYAVLKEFALGKGKEERDATEAFEGGLNDHAWSAREKMKDLTIARIV
ncbi:BQ2448_5515 [Microbotryum intermedium]|uniref:Acyl-CoA desaturase n=1 Tax=Microbotryum intermedium TaxID=269621 RepID=A0A238F7R2_9BASI|nr:BQ2448_5515 [Microbotryum intermedium]